MSRQQSRAVSLTSQVRHYLGSLRHEFSTPDFLPHRLLAARLGFCPLPNFIIIGAQKAGTSSLYHYLTMHPSVKRALRKEARFFDQNYSKGLTWYRAYFPIHPRGERGSLVTGEATPNYLFHPHAPERVARTLPEVKLIVLLRNPIDRAYSHYHHSVRLKFEQLSFEDALAREEERLAGELERLRTIKDYPATNYMECSYVSKGIYVEQLRRWMGCIPRERFLILKFETFFSDPVRHFAEVLTFLELPDVPLTTSFPKKKEGRYDRNSMSEATRMHLRVVFCPYNEQLADFLGMDLDDWD